MHKAHYLANFLYCNEITGKIHMSLVEVNSKQAMPDMFVFYDFCLEAAQIQISSISDRACES